MEKAFDKSKMKNSIFVREPDFKHHVHCLNMVNNYASNVPGVKLLQPCRCLVTFVWNHS